MSGQSMKNTVLAVILVTVSATVLAQNAPTPAAAATAKPSEPGKAAAPSKAAPAAAPAAVKPAAETAKTQPKEVTKDPVAVPAKPTDASKPVIAEVRKPLTAPPCPIAEFRAIGMETQDVVERRAKALDWLAKKGKQCSPEKLVAIRNNRPQWMGHADSTVVAAAVDALLESSIEGNPAVLNLLYGTQPPPPKPPEDKKPAK